MTADTGTPTVPARPGRAPCPAAAARPPTRPGRAVPLQPRAATSTRAGGVRTGTREIRFAALGDSLTEGLGDPVAEGWRGWAPLLAQGLAAEPSQVRLLNCSRSGALTKDVVEEQLPRALDHRPHIASVVIGANDTLRGGFDIEAVAHRLDFVMDDLRAHGAQVLTACLPDPGRILRLPWPLARPLGRRMAALNQVVHALSERYDAVHLHAARCPWVADRSCWSADRLHPSELGHRLLAREFHDLLASRGLADGEAPSTTPGGPGPGTAASLLWMATRGTRWIADRCTDLLPDLVRLAGQEVRHRMAGTDRLLDLRSREAAAGALARLRGTSLGQ